MHDDSAEPLHRNRLLAALPGDEHQILAPHLSRVRLPFKQILYERDRPIDFVYFLERGVASLVQQMEDGTTIEVGTVGPEGVVGLPIFLEASSMSGTGFIQVPGQGCRIEAGVFDKYWIEPRACASSCHVTLSPSSHNWLRTAPVTGPMLSNSGSPGGSF